MQMRKDALIACRVKQSLEAVAVSGFSIRGRLRVSITEARWQLKGSVG